MAETLCLSLTIWQLLCLVLSATHAAAAGGTASAKAYAVSTAVANATAKAFASALAAASGTCSSCKDRQQVGSPAELPAQVPPAAFPTTNSSNPPSSNSTQRHVPMASAQGLPSSETGRNIAEMPPATLTSQHPSPNPCCVPRGHGPNAAPTKLVWHNPRNASVLKSEILCESMKHLTAWL